jgi:N-acetylglucosaminyldiphosphoundecaprenol N-acetyl-beta-D-mannosaminyltransferase
MRNIAYRPNIGKECMSGKTVEVSGIPVSCCSFDDVLLGMERVIRDRSSGNYISITNTESMYHALRIPEHLRYIKGARFSLCDGIGSVIAGFAWGHRIPRRNGPILMLKTCEYGVSRGWRHFFYGGKEGVADLMAEKLTEKFPGLITAGTYCPPFRSLTPEEDEEVVRLIDDSKPDIIWVGLGLLKQERWVADHLDKIQAPWMVGVGAAFDYHAGTVKWAPGWVQAIGMEWLYRTILQPRLRIRRYYWSYIFMFQSLGQGLIERIRPGGV